MAKSTMDIIREKYKDLVNPEFEGLDNLIEPSPIATDGRLFDELRAAFGVGDQKDGEPWFKFRARHVAMLKRIRESRKVPLEDLVVAFEYAKAEGKDIQHVSWLFQLVDEAKRWKRAKDADAQGADLEARIAEAVQIEAQDPDSQWMTRLVRAAGPARQAVYDEWLAQRGDRA